MFEQVSKALQDRPQIQDRVLFLVLDYESSMIGISPLGIKNGDQICSFPHSDITGVLREDGSLSSGHKIIFRCTVAHSQPRRRWAILRPRPGSYGDIPESGWDIDVWPAPIACISISELQILTAVSEYLEGK